MENKPLEKKAKIFNIQKYNVYDGPGVRTLIFFQGCPLRCKWCSNPEGLEKKYKIMYKSNHCVNCGACVDVCPMGIHSMSSGTHTVDRSKNCIACKKCEDVCLQSALKTVGEEKTIGELVKSIEEDRTFYEMSGGGVTLGGGEVLMQAEAATNLLMACKNIGINTAIETCGYTSLDVIKNVAKYTDLFLFDIKQINPEKHLYWTGVRNEIILENLKFLLENGFNVEIRVPLIKDVNTETIDIENVIKFLLPYKDYKNLKGIDLLPYHKMGANKYSQLGLNYEMQGDFHLDNYELDKIENLIKKYELNAKVIRH
jgi:pyruvate formate lyase activating enzyme